MEELKKKLQDLLEVEELDLSKPFSDYEEWDSLTGLSILAMLDADYHQAMTVKEILAFTSIEDFCNAVISR
jgi:acyl carrier protein